MSFIVFITFISYLTCSATAAPLESVEALIPQQQQQPPYLALLPITLVASSDALTHDLLKQILTSINSLKEKKPSHTKYQSDNQTQYGAAKLVDIGKGYKLHVASVKRVDWFHSMKFCKALGLQLVSLETKEKSDLVQAYLGAHGYNEYMWTSGIRLDDTWVWSAINEEFSYTGWHNTQPNKNKEYCVLVQPGFWADMTCGSVDYFGYICEPSYT